MRPGDGRGAKYNAETMLDRRVHRWFAQYWNRQLRSENEAILGMRREVAGGAVGRVLELGCGPGSNFGYYQPPATRVIGLDPNPYMLEFARQRTINGAPSELVRGSAEALPFKSGCFDSVVSTANFCSIGDPEIALREVRRTLRNGGKYRFFDHVRSEESLLLALLQDVITPVHRRLLGTGCRPNRRIAALVERAGFGSTEIETRKPVPVFPTAIYRPHVIGIARR